MLIWAVRRGQMRTLIRQVADTTSQLDKFNAIWADAIENVPFYAEWAERHQLPRQIADLKELSDWPVLEKQELIRNREKLTREWVRDENGERVRVTNFHESVTGGSTGEPLHFRTMPGEDRPIVANDMVGRGRIGVYPDTRMFLLWGHRHFYGQGWQSNLRFKKRQIRDWFANHLRADATDLSPAALRKDYAMMVKFNPECIVAYSASLLALVRTLKGDIHHCQPQPSTSTLFPALRAIICTAGPLTAHEREEIASFFGVPVGMEYGSMECGTMAYMTPATDDRYRVFDGTHIIHQGQVEKIENDERTEILVTTLTKRYLPLIRYKIGDYMDDVEVRLDGTVHSFSEVSGRTGDMIDLGNGIRFHGYSLMVCAEENPKIIAYQLRVDKAKTTVTFVAQVKSPLTAEERSRIVLHAADVAHVVPGVIDVEEMNELIKSASGKVKLVVE